MATLEQLIAYVKGKGYSFSLDVEEVGPTNEWTVEEQKEDCCQEVSGADPCVEDGKVEPWDGWTPDQANTMNNHPSPTPYELLERAEAIYGKGNVALQVNTVGATTCGEMHTTWTGELGCCDDPDIEPLTWTQTVDYLAPDETGDFCAEGGTKFYNWSVENNGALVIVSTWSTPKGECARVRATDCLCKPLAITVTDACDQVLQHDVASEEGEWVLQAEVVPLPFDHTEGASGFTWVTGQTEEYKTQQAWTYASVQRPPGTSDIESIVCGAFPSNDEVVVPYLPAGYQQCPDSVVIWNPTPINGLTANTYASYRPNDSYPGGTSPRTYHWECDDTEELLYDDVNSVKIFADNSSGFVVWTGGKAPFTVTVSGQEIFTNSSKTEVVATTSDRTYRLYTGDTCGMSSVTISDKCGESVQGSIAATTGSYRGDCHAHYGKTFTYVWDNNYIHGQLGMGWNTDYPCTLWPYQYDYPGNTGWVLPFQYGVWAAAVYKWNPAGGGAWYASDYYYTSGHTRADIHDQYLAQLTAWGIPHDTSPSSYAPNGPIDMLQSGMMPCGHDCVWEC